MTSVDRRIVQMQFDNAQFEEGVAQTLRSLDKLDQQLEFANAEVGFGNLQRAANGVTLDGISDGIDSIDSKFSMLGVAAATVMNQMVTKAMNAGEKIAYALSLKGVNDGWNEYNLKMDNIQTILMNTKDKGTTIKDVEKALDELNTYADQTTYVFSDMTRAIGQFTTAGIDLDTSVGAIKGFSNLAASVGADNTALARAEYQMSQAINSGVVKLMDWRSMENAGGMGGQVMQKALLETAKEVYKGNEDALKVVKEIESGKLSFRNSFNEKESPFPDWLTSDVLLKTLNKFSKNKDMVKAATEIRTFPKLVDTVGEEIGSGWAKTWELLLGGFEDSTKLWTDIGKFFVGDGDKMIGLVSMYTSAINDPLEKWVKDGGRVKMIESLTRVFNAFVPVIRTVSDAFLEVFPPVTGKNLMDLTEKFEKWSKSIKFSEETLADLKAIFLGVFELVKAFGNVLVISFKIVTTIGVPILKLLAGVLFAVLSALGGFIDEIEKTYHPLESLEKRLSGTKKTFKDFFSELKKGAPNLSGIGKSFKEMGKNLAHAVGSIPAGLMKTIGGVVELLHLDEWGKSLKEFGKSFIEGAKQTFSEIWADLKTLFAEMKPGDYINAAQLLISGGGLAALLPLIDQAKEFLGKFQEVADQGKNIFTQDSPLTAAKEVIDNVKGSLNSFKDTLQAYQTDLHAGALIKVAAAVLMLAVSIKFLSSIEPGRMKDATIAVASLVGVMVAAMFALNMIKITNFRTFGSVSNALIKMSVALAILASSLKELAEVKDFEKVSEAAIIMSALLGAMVGSVLALEKFGKKATKAGMQMVLMAAALNIIAQAIAQLAEMPAERIEKAGLALSIALGAMTGAALLLSNFGKKGAKGALGVLILAGSLKIIANSIGELSKTNPERMLPATQALMAVIGELAGISVILSKFGKAKSLIGAVAMVLMATNLTMIADSISKLAQVEDPNSLIAAVKAMSIVLAALLGVLLLVSSMQKRAITAAVAIRVLTTCLDEIASSLSVLADISKMTGEGLENAALTLAATLGAMSVAIIALSQMDAVKMIAGAAALVIVAQALQIIAPAFAIVAGLSMDQVAVGLVAFAGALLILVAAAYLVQPVIVPVLALAAAFGIFALAAMAIGGAVLAVATGLSILASISGQEADNIKNTMVALSEGMRDSAENIGAAIVLLIKSFVVNLAAGSAEICDAIAVMIIQMLKTVATRMPEIMKQGANIIIGFINGITTEIPRIVDAAAKAIISFINALAKGIKENYKEFKKAVKNLFLTIGDCIADLATDFLNFGKDIIGHIKDGIDAALSTIGDIAGSIFKGFQDGNDTDQYYKEGEKAGAAFNEGMKDKKALDEHSPSKASRKIAKFAMVGFVLGVKERLREVGNSGETAGKLAMKKLGKAVEQASNLFEIDSEPTIKPVVDLSSVKSAASEATSMLSKTQMIDAQMAAYTPFAAVASGNAMSESVSNYYITLDYRAGDDPNTIVRGIAEALKYNNRTGK